MDEAKMELPNEVSFDVVDRSDHLCPNCNSKGLSLFYSVNDIPVHSCMLMSSKSQGLKYPTRNLQLGFCPNCTFISNVKFESELHNYNSSYEETQGFSACFNAFAKSLAQRVIDRYDIRNKTILEIGCGKGEFLALMCQLGDNKGIGIDPAYVPERNPDKTRSRVEFIKDFYSPKYSYLDADVICCRHTLEHIAPTLEFMQQIRQTIADRPDTLIFFELPDVMRVLKEGAFWDIYYEHCSYFNPDSLAGLFRISGFNVDEIYNDYDDQYLIITAYPSPVSDRHGSDMKNYMDMCRKAVSEFAKKCSQKIDYWLKTIHEFNRQGKRIVIWGSGSKAVAFLTTLKLSDPIEYIVDINPYRHGKYLPGTGHKIVAPEFLEEYKPHKIIVMNPVYCDEIRQELDNMNVKADLLPV
ncbi:MAG: methyltransferase domain-containing protein [Sedimentisphaerales bacterium]|nr:methyltransferase domain-containing protein [Sedimentisphaerales bacterium]